MLSISKVSIWLCFVVPVTELDFPVRTDLLPPGFTIGYSRSEAPLVSYNLFLISATGSVDCLPLEGISPLACVCVCVCPLCNCLER